MVETIPQPKEILVNTNPKDTFTVNTNRGKRHTVSKDNYILVQGRRYSRHHPNEAMEDEASDLGWEKVMMDEGVDTSVKGEELLGELFDQGLSLEEEKEIDFEKFEKITYLRRSKARYLHVGRKYNTTVGRFGKGNLQDYKNWVVTSSTMANMNTRLVPHDQNLIIQSIEMSGAQCADLISAIKNEMGTLAAFPSFNVIIMVGLNDWKDNNMNMELIRQSVMNIKTYIMGLNPRSRVNFVRVPLVPMLCKFSKDEHVLTVNKTKDLLEYNHFLAKTASCSEDRRLSMELMGTHHQDGDWDEYSIGALGTYKVQTPVRHDKSCWREFWTGGGSKQMDTFLHLTDDIRRGFWWHSVVPHFQDRMRFPK